MMNQHSYLFYIAMFFIIFMILLAVYLLSVVRPFLRQRRYIKMEMGRSLQEDMPHWQREMKRAYMSLIPIVGNWLSKKE